MRIPLPYGFTALPFDEMIRRLLKSGYDSSCYSKMCEEIFPIAEAKLHAKEYARALRNDKPELIERLAKQCAGELPKFRSHHYDWEDVVFETLTSLKVPSKWYSHIFGHKGEERQLYPTIVKQLRREFENVHNTSSLRSRLVRFADFTVVKKKTFGGYKVISFDAKTTSAAFDHFLNQARDFQRFSDQVYLVATPGLVLEAGKKYGRPALAQESVVRKLEDVGAGLYILDTTSNEWGLLKEAKDMNTEKEAKNDALRELSLI